MGVGGQGQPPALRSAAPHTRSTAPLGALWASLDGGTTVGPTGARLTSPGATPHGHHGVPGLRGPQPQPPGCDPDNTACVGTQTPAPAALVPGNPARIRENVLGNQNRDQGQVRLTSVASVMKPGS